MDSARAVMIVGLAATLGCGGPEGSSNYTTCSQSTDCRTARCTVVDECLVDECEWELTYQFAGEEYESNCTFGTTFTSTTYPINGGSGRAVVERDLVQCFYSYDVQFFDYDEEQNCSTIDECTLQELECAASPDGPNCTIVQQTNCALGATAENEAEGAQR